ncbi:hypothetical protein AB0K14_20470 [Actinosynnema sp. NPDC050801]|uniref:hypothetical protein n=1 Tax=unclassified Actinosynnema TaxID=2637065 RepID=UPI0033D0E13D
MWPHIARSTFAVAVALGVAACGSGVFGSPTGRTTTDSATTTTRTTGSGGETGGTTGGETTGTTGGETGGETATGTRYGWFLPEGPSSIATNEDIVYQRLARDRNCQAAQEFLDRGAWKGMLSPRNVLLYQAAIDLCMGDESQARAMYGRIARHRWNLEFGSTEPVDCPTYQAVRSVLDQRDPGSFACTKGSPPEWPDRQAKDDPRTDSNEATTTTTTVTTTTPTSTTTRTRTATTTTS